MNRYTRRAFLREVGGGMLVAGLGVELTMELGLAAEVASEEAKRLTFGELEPLVSLMQETEPDRLTALLVERLRAGTSLRTLTAAGALANARTFGGQDYIGFHTFMALAPAYRMSQRLPESERPLAVLKVLYRNAKRIQEAGGRAGEVLHAIEHHGPVSGAAGGEQLREASRSADVEGADRVFAGWAGGPIGEAFNHLQFAVEDEVDVHRVVLAWRGWDTRELAGEEWGHCLLRQSIRYCAQMEKHMKGRGAAVSPVRALLPKLLDEYGLLGRSLGTREGEDAWVDELAGVVYGGSREEAATAVAAALREGWSAEAIGEAISVAANRLVLHDPGGIL